MNLKPRKKRNMKPRNLKKFQRIGDIIIINIHPELKKYSKLIGKSVLENFKNIRAVYRKTDMIKGEYRKPSIEIIAGDKNPITIHKENKCLYKIDVSKLMFAKGNITERGRIAKIARPNEIVVDMFAGIGYFSIPIAKFANPRKIYAIEKNPVAIKFLKENCRLNHITNMEIIHDDCRKAAKKLNSVADRIIMGYIKNTETFLPSAFNMLKPTGVIHYHNTYSRSELWNKPIDELKTHGTAHGYRLKILYKHRIKSYAPNIFHIVIDAEFTIKHA
jgi:tRNA wybutosine-synthesizing protein 2